MQEQNAFTTRRRDCADGSSYIRQVLIKQTVGKRPRIVDVVCINFVVDTFGSVPRIMLRAVLVKIDVRAQGLRVIQRMNEEFRRPSIWTACPAVEFPCFVGVKQMCLFEAPRRR